MFVQVFVGTRSSIALRFDCWKVSQNSKHFLTQQIYSSLLVFVAVSHQFIGISGFMGTTLHKKWSFPLRISSVNVRKRSDVSLDRWFLHNILLGQFFGQQWYKRSTSTFSESDIRDKGDIFIISATAASDELFYSFKYFYVSIAYVKSYSNIDSVINFS